MKLNKRKQGISLIVLVITIIVMIIIAAAIILALNSANLTSKTSWAQLSSDRASLQSEYAVILADIIAKDNPTDDNYIGLSIEDIRNNPEFQEWCRKVKNTNSLFTIYGDEATEKATPAEIEVRLKLTTKEIDAMGLTVVDKKVKGYDWVKIKLTNPYNEEGWEVAYVCNNGKWEDTPITKGNKAEGDFVAKFYKQENEMVDLTSLGLPNSNAYHMVVEGEGEMPEVCDISTYTGSAWVKPAIEWLIDLETNGSSTKDPGIYLYISKVTICEGIENIPYEFFYMSQIKEVEIADSVTSIGYRAFSDCDSLTNITIPDSVTSIGYRAFSDCDSLTNIIIPNSVTSIGYEAFSNCDSLTNIIIPSSVRNIGYYVFAFSDSLTNITIQNGITSIGADTFGYCKSLISITIPNSVESIGEWAFSNCTNLTNITIPNSVTSIGSGIFLDCNSLTDVYYEGTEEDWKKISIASYNEDLTSATIHYNSKIK